MTLLFVKIYFEEWPNRVRQRKSIDKMGFLAVKKMLFSFRSICIANSKAPRTNITLIIKHESSTLSRDWF